VSQRLRGPLSLPRLEELEFLRELIEAGKVVITE
jgi:hypothetical protein